MYEEIFDSTLWTGDLQGQLNARLSEFNENDGIAMSIAMLPMHGTTIRQWMPPNLKDAESVTISGHLLGRGSSPVKVRTQYKCRKWYVHPMPIPRITHADLRDGKMN